MRIKERRTLGWERVRTTCVEKDWYNEGTNEAYSAMLHEVSKLEDVSTDDLHRLAENIYEHTKKLTFCGMTDTEAVVYVMYVLAGRCVHLFEIINDEGSKER